MADAPEDIVRQAYDHIAQWYLGWVLHDRSPRERYTERILEQLPPSPRILELGCGPGVPVLSILLDHGAQVTANDISTTQIAMAKARCPQTQFVVGNMAMLAFPARSFDGALSFYTLFHLPRVQLRSLLSKIFNWLKPGGLFALNLAVFDEAGIYGEMMGHGMFWSSYGARDSCAILETVGFELLEADEIKSGDGKLKEDDPDYNVEFLWAIVRKPKTVQEERVES